MSQYNGLLPGLRERTVSEDGKVHIQKTQTLDPHFFEAIKANKEAPGPRQGVMQYKGSIPVVLAQRWACECGAAIGTREFSAYVKRKLASGEFNRLVGK